MDRIFRTGTRVVVAFAAVVMMSGCQSAPQVPTPPPPPPKVVQVQPGVMAVRVIPNAEDTAHNVARIMPEETTVIESSIGHKVTGQLHPKWTAPARKTRASKGAHADAKRKVSRKEAKPRKPKRKEVTKFYGVAVWDPATETLRQGALPSVTANVLRHSADSGKHIMRLVVHYQKAPKQEMLRLANRLRQDILNRLTPPYPGVAILDMGAGAPVHTSDGNVYEDAIEVLLIRLEEQNK